MNRRNGKVLARFAAAAIALAAPAGGMAEEFVRGYLIDERTVNQIKPRRFQFMPESVVDQRVTAVYFNNGMKVERVALYGVEDGKIFDFITRTTPTGGSDQSFLGQVFKGMTKFSPL